MCAEALVICSASQGEAACARPITPLYVPNEAASACAVLCNSVHALCMRAAPDIDPAAVVDEMCAAGLPVALRALLHENSALLGGAEEDMDALAPVMDLLHRLMEVPRSRAALLTDAPDGGASLLLTVFAVTTYHPHASTDGTAPAASSNASAYAGRVQALIQELQGQGDATARQAVIALTTHFFGPLTTDLDWSRPLASAMHTEGRRRLFLHEWQNSGLAGAAAAQRDPHHTACDPTGVGDCAGCTRTVRAGERPFQKCARCQATAYCSRACQVAHWKTHKRICTPALGAE